MPQGLGRLQAKVRARYPRLAAFYERYDHTIQGILIAAFVSLVAYIGYTANEAANQAERAGRDVRVLRQASPCLTAKEHPTRKNLRRCHRSFGQAVALVTPLQACRLIQKGTTLLVINGQRVRGIECKVARRAPEGLEGPTRSTSAQQTVSPSGSGAPVSPVPNQGGSGGHNGQNGGGQGKQRKPKPAPAPAPAPTAPAPAPEDHPGNSETGKGKAKGQADVSIDLLPPGQVGKIDLFPDQLPVESCNPVISLNC